MKQEKELSILDYLPKVLPIIDVLFIVWIAINSPRPWVTTFISIGMPVFGFVSMLLFGKKKNIGVPLVGICTSIPVFFLNLWGSSECPTWLVEITLIAGGLMLSRTILDRFMVLVLALVTTIIPLYLNSNPVQFITTIIVGEIALWFLIERSVAFMNMQKKLIAEQKQLVEEKQKEMIDSIQYARRIQHSLLPNEKIISRDLDRLNKKL